MVENRCYRKRKRKLYACTVVPTYYFIMSVNLTFIFFFIIIEIIELYDHKHLQL